MRAPDAWPGRQLLQHAAIAIGFAVVLLLVNTRLEPLMSSYLAMAAMYATAMFGMVILVGLSGQVSLGNGAIMGVGAYTFAVTSLNWTTVPLLGLPWNAVWSMVAAALAGIVVGLIIGGLGARLSGPYLAGLTLGIAVLVPALANRFPDLLGGEDGLRLTVPYPAGGYASSMAADEGAAIGADATASAGPEIFAVPSASSSAMVEYSQDDFAAMLNASASPTPSPMAAGPTDMASPTSVPTLVPAAEPSMLPSTAPLDGTSTVDLGWFTSVQAWQAGMAIVLACVAGFVALNLVRGRQRSRWIAVRDNPVAAALVGVPPASTKVSAFVMSSFFAALAGAAFAQILQYVGPLSFTLGLSLSLLVGVVLGGRSSLIGALIGGVLIVMLPEVIGAATDGSGLTGQVMDNVPSLVYGLLVVVVVLTVPEGLVGIIGRIRRLRHRRSGQNLAEMPSDS